MLKTVVFIVNYKSSGLALQAVKSVLDSASQGPIKVVVVDNSEDSDKAERLRQDLPPGVVLLVSPQNIGFGRACNLAFERFEGEQILLINPDARLLPGCLLRLQRTLSSSEKVGAVSPHIFWDDGLNFYLPPSTPLSLFEFQDICDTWEPESPVSMFLSNIWRYHSIKIWRSKKPVRVNNLSGGLVLLKRESVQKAGGLFDPLFFLYFEDTDLFIRLRKAGYTLVTEPRARAVHYYDQCGRREWEWKRSLMAESKEILLEKHRKSWKSHVTRPMALLKTRTRRDGEQHMLAQITSPFGLKVPSHLHKRWLFEISPNRNFIPSAARFGRGPVIDFPKDCWKMLAPGQYFCRIGGPTAFGKPFTVISLLKDMRCSQSRREHESKGFINSATAPTV